ncbi:MAG: DUF2459 domain-containing protein [Sphingorhabdus sp.]
MKLFRINSVLTALRALVAWPLLVIGIYMVAALVGSHIPANNDWTQPATGVDLFVETNGVHVSLIVPMAAAGEDLSDLIRPDQLNDPQLYGTHVMIGWGHGGVYRNAQTWTEVRSGDVTSAIFGSDDVLLHVYHMTDPLAAPYRKPFRVSEAQFHQIVRDIRASFRLHGGHSVAVPAYSPDNLFYAAKGRYTAIHTCNEWTAKVLRRAGVRMGAWTPMPGGVMRWF